MDNEALSVTYRADRGEPRGPHKKGDSWQGRGSCIDCNQCVAACPMGIDIRDGAQLECINCGLCIDACDEVMLKIGQPLRLIAYDTDANVARRARGERARFRLIRPRTILYSVVLVIVGSLMMFGLSTRRTIDLDVLRDRNPNFVTLADGSVRNGYTLKVMNRADQGRDFWLTIRGIQPRAVNLIGVGNVSLPAKLAVGPDKVRTLRVLLTVAPHDWQNSHQRILFSVADAEHHETRTVRAVFVSGDPR